MVTPTSKLAQTRETLLERLAGSPLADGVTLTYQALPQSRPYDQVVPVVRALVLAPERRAVAGASELVVRQDGLLRFECLFPRSTGRAAVRDLLGGIAALYRQQTLGDGVQLTGEVRTARIGAEADRIRWDVVIPWRVESLEEAGGNVGVRAGAQLPTPAQGEAAVRNLWLLRIEQASTAEGWAGLRTFWDDVGPFPVPPALPWCGYWSEITTDATPEHSGPRQVIGRSLVQLHTDRALGTAGADRITERIIAEHQCSPDQVRLDVPQIEGERVSAAGTWQTSMRIGWRFEVAG